MKGLYLHLPVFILMLINGFLFCLTIISLVRWVNLETVLIISKVRWVNLHPVLIISLVRWVNLQPVLIIS